MTAEIGQGRSVRATLAQATRYRHLALHEDPVLGALALPTLTETGYLRALAVFQHVFQTVEAERQARGAWPALSLAPECSALLRDLGQEARAVGQPRFRSAAALLGGLYVLHGAALGRAGLRRNVRRTLPDSPQNFLSLTADPMVWRRLVEVLESSTARERPTLIASAQDTFEWILARARAVA